MIIKDNYLSVFKEIFNITKETSIKYYQCFANDYKYNKK